VVLAEELDIVRNPGIFNLARQMVGPKHQQVIGALLLGTWRGVRM
jgi:hypothetical protein